jgi:DHA2 family multidrug resistance protein
LTAPAVPAALPEGRRFAVNCVVMLPTVMHSVDITIAAVALPSMQGALSATQDQISWILTSYVVAVAIVTPATGWLAARLGRRRLFLASVFGFTVVSVLCGLASSLDEILVYRFLQGAFGAGLIPLSQAVILDTYPRDEHGRAMAIWGIGVMVGPIIGPTLGAYLTEYISWHWVFFINLPIGAAALIGIAALVPETNRDLGRAFDAFGFLALAGALACLQLVMDRGERLDWFANQFIIAGCVAAAIGFYWYIVHSATAERPFLTPAMFRDRNFLGGLVLGFGAHVGLYATVALMPPLLQNVLNYPVLTSGFLFIPRAIGTLAGMFIVSRLAKKADSRALMLTGFAIASYGLWEMTRFTLDVSEAAIVWSGFVLGLGLGLVFVPASTITFSTLPKTMRTEGAGVYAVVRSLGASLGISVFVTILVRDIQIQRSSMVPAVNPFNPMLSESAQLGGTELSRLSSTIDRQAEMNAYVNDFWWIMLATLAIMPLVALVRPPKKDGGKS